eukprot:15356854-Ditylum_brightwellii.AAC.1
MTEEVMEQAVATHTPVTPLLLGPVTTRALSKVHPITRWLSLRHEEWPPLDLVQYVQPVGLP